MRTATADDAEAISKLASEFHAYLNALGDPTKFHFNAATYLRDGFGDRPAFVGLVAESEDHVIGYAIIHFGYDTDQSRRNAYLVDVFVTQTWRGRGIGKALMARAAQTAREHNAEVLWWGVYERNDSALRFYEDLGARYIKGIRFMSMDVEDLLDKK